MKFWDYEKAEREEWRKQDITAAFAEEILALALIAKEDCLAAAREGDARRTSRAVGTVDGYSNVVNAMAEDPK